MWRGCFCAVVAVCAAAPAQALEFRGFVEPEARLFVRGDDPRWDSARKPDARLEMLGEAGFDVDYRAVVDTDLAFDGSRVEPELQLRELWVRYLHDRWVVSAGKQLVRWGTIDEFGVADVFVPQDLIDPSESWVNRKRGLWMARGAWEGDRLTLTLLASPFREASVTPNRETSFRGAAVGTATPVPEVIDGPLRAEDLQVGGRLYYAGELGDFGISLARIPEQVAPLASPTTTVTSRHVGIVAVEGTIPLVPGFGIHLESALMLGEDFDGDNPQIRNSRLHYAAALKGFLSEALSFQLGFTEEQLFASGNAEEVRERRLGAPVGNPWLLLDQHLTHLSLRYRYGDAGHSLKLRYLNAYETDGHLIHPEVAFVVAPATTFTFGMQVFAGSRTRSGIARLRDFSNVYTALRAAF